MDRIETNFRLILLNQRELSLSQRQMDIKLTAIAGHVGTIASQMAVLATQLGEVAEIARGSAVKSDETADRLEESFKVMLGFAEGQAEIRATLADCVRRLDVLEGKKAS